MYRNSELHSLPIFITWYHSKGIHWESNNSFPSRKIYYIRGNATSLGRIWDKASQLNAFLIPVKRMLVRVSLSLACLADAGWQWWLDYKQYIFLVAGQFFPIFLSSPTDGEATIFQQQIFPTTFCRCVIWTMEVQQTGTFDGRSTVWATAQRHHCKVVKVTI